MIVGVVSAVQFFADSFNPGSAMALNENFFILPFLKQNPCDVEDILLCSP